MAHIHLEDGSFPLAFAALWWLCAIIIIAAIIKLVRRDMVSGIRKITLAAFCTAAAFAIFQVSIPVFGGVHVNLTPLIGILAGPVYGSLVALAINLLSAAIGHGGWSMIGANTLISITEVATGWGIFTAIGRQVPDLSLRAITATFIALLFGNLVMIGLILVSGIQGVHQTAAQVLSGLALVAGINIIIALIEAVTTGLIVAFIGRQRPDLLREDSIHAP